MINFIVNNSSFVIGGAVVFFSLIGIYFLSKESKRLSKTTATKSKDAKSADKSKQKGLASEPSKVAKGSKVEKLIDTRPRYARPTPKTIEESESDYRNVHISKVIDGIYGFDKKKHKFYSKSKPFTYVSTQKKRDMVKYTKTPEEKELLEKMSFVNNKNGNVAKLAKRDKMLQMPKPTIVEPEPQPEAIEEEHELTAEEKRQQKFGKYFDKSRRLSKKIEEDDMDTLFESHLSDSYMDINIDRHLNIGKSFEKQLYSKAAYVLAHGEIKITDNAEVDLSDKATRKAWLKQKSKEERKRMMREGQPYIDFLDDELKKEEDVETFIMDNYDNDLDGDSIRENIKLSPKNIIMVNTVYNRERKRFKSSKFGKK